jgi:hypothetical protein
MLVVLKFVLKILDNQVALFTRQVRLFTAVTDSTGEALLLILSRLEAILNFTSSEENKRVYKYITARFV